MSAPGPQSASWWRRFRDEPVVANFGWLTFEKLVRMTLGLFVGTWVARYLGPADYGTLNYGIAITGILSVVPMLGLDAIVRRRLRQTPGDTGAILGTAFLLKLGAGVLTYAATITGMWLFEPNPTARFVVIVTALLHVHQSMMIFDVYFQSHLQARYGVWAQNIAFTLSALGRVVLILAGAKIEAFALMLVIEMPAASLLFVWFYRRNGGQLGTWQWRGNLASALLRESWPLALAAIASILYLRLDQVMLVHLASPQEAGRYAAAARLYELCGFLPVALAASLAPALLTAHATDRADFDRRVRGLFARAAQLAYAAAVPGILLSGVIVSLLFGPAYAATVPMFIVLLLGYPFLAVGIAREQVLIAEQKPRRQLAAMISGVALNLLLNLILIPRFGGLGAAGASALAQATAGVLSSFAWRDTRLIGRWQLQALVAPWRKPPLTP